jgi:HAD superfamily hydrolase (TIGR01490 family)
MTNSQPIAFFDVDKTLCDCYSGFHTTMELIRRRIVKKRRLLLALIYNAIGRVHLRADVRKMYEIAISDMAGTHLEDILRIGRETFEKRVKPKMYVGGMEEIKKARAAGFYIALISSGPYMLIKTMEEFLKADASFSNGPVVSDGILQRTFQEPLCYKEGKVLIAKRFAEERRVSLKDCRFYSDSISDLPLLSLVGHPIVVNPDKKLRQLAMKKHWQILHFQHTLGK